MHDDRPDVRVGLRGRGQIVRAGYRTITGGSHSGNKRSAREPGRGNMWGTGAPAGRGGKGSLSPDSTSRYNRWLKAPSAAISGLCAFGQGQAGQRKPEKPFVRNGGRMGLVAATLVLALCLD